jgi:hypothetical protein
MIRFQIRTIWPNIRVNMNSFALVILTLGVDVAMY